MKNGYLLTVLPESVFFVSLKLLSHSLATQRMRSFWSQCLGKLNFKEGHLSKLARQLSPGDTRMSLYETKEAEHEFVPLDTNEE